MKISNLLARKLYGMTQTEAWDQGVCICCKKKPALLPPNATFQELSDDREYRISAFCPTCLHEGEEPCAHP